MNSLMRISIGLIISLWVIGKSPVYAEFRLSSVHNQFPPHVKQIIDNRCVVCHGCYSSPCNLKLDSLAGLERGASPKDMYLSRPFKAMDPNRLLQDAQKLEDWQSEKHAFHSVHMPLDGAPSLIEQLLEARHNPEKNSPKKNFKFSPETSRSCAKDQNELDKYLSKNGSLGGMPYGMAPLSENELDALLSWIRGNQLKYLTHNLEDEFKLTPKAQPLGLIVEDFLNRNTLKETLVARYLYEHLFSANLHFEGSPNREFYRLVRAENRHGPVVEIATRRPFDDPKKPFFYRLKRVVETIVQKNHTPFLVTSQTLAKWQQDFLMPDWNVKSLPAYGTAGANPFATFNAIPAKARYRFFLDNANYFIRSFIHGPVCNGQGATNVIRDHFWIFMLDPKYDLLSNDPQFEKEVAYLLDLPASNPDRSMIKYYRKKNFDYQELATKKYHDLWKGNLQTKYLWNGDRHNTNAAQTVYRHFKSAGVFDGLVGSPPKTIWVMDYSIFERIYYDLVAGFDVYGNSFHKITTRLYMDLLRTESEDMYLSLHKEKNQSKLRKYWNHGFGSLKRMYHPYYYKAAKTSSLPEGQMLENHSTIMYQAMLEHQGKKVVGDFAPTEKNIEKLSKLMGKKGSYPRYFPEVTILRINLNNKKLGVALMANKDRPFANHLFFEPKSPQNDVLNLVEALDVTHANLFLDVQEDEVDKFIADLAQIDSRKSWKKFLKNYAVSRLASNFWEVSDWIQAESIKMHPVRGGIIDLTRYKY